MDGDPPPFGYTFDGFPLAQSPGYSSAGPTLLSEIEQQSLQQFFSQNPFESEPAFFAPSNDTKPGFNEYEWDHVPPPNVHQVSTIPNQALLHRGFHLDSFVPDPPPGRLLTNTDDDLQAASTLLSNAHAPYPNSRYSLPHHGLGPSNTQYPDLSSPSSNRLLVNTPHGLLDETIAAVLPLHSENGSVDAQVAAQLTQIPYATDLAQHDPHRPQLRRAYTYGTDTSFNNSGYAAPNPHMEDAINERLAQNVHNSIQPLMRPPDPHEDTKPANSNGFQFPVGISEIRSDTSRQSEDETSEDEEDRPTKKRRKAPTNTSTKMGNGKRKSVSAASHSKNRKTSVDEHVGKKKRLSSAGQKAQRENLTEEQKRSNHILSEQKRRNLIKRGFDDLHDLVPAIRNGGLSKSGVLNEAAAFLEKLIADNNKYLDISGDAHG